ncbi:damage-inducible protein DinB [Mucilaginibacter hurinus]|uniref:Damage-inducible protein DinB n=1 Tax=Mucilaginibacter hurinus TaxID=2201324 RepID=A0A367GRJ5_9SPHI|nr:DinB family protein [Mucilaginibacter hurinus]RCH56077.1 damage-inducible protein DinB [Mucilaginibacter hurinus]
MDDITFAQAFAKELEAETGATRKCIERIPESEWGWKPHETSMPLGYLTHLTAEIPLWIASMIEATEIDFVTYPHFQANTSDELVAHFNDNVQKAQAALARVKNNDLDETFELKANGKVVFSAPKRVHIEMTVNHMVHHRGQLTVYMRLKGIKVPSIYGPSADDNNF